MAMNIIYGPTKSLRYGSTLGVNLLGASKVCSYNCGYCDLGPTELTMNKIRNDYVFPTTDQIKLAFREYIQRSVTIDTVVISGNGEPTLYPQFEEAMQTIVELRNEHLPKVKIVILSSGAHLTNKRIATGMNLLDERVIKVDVGNDAMMSKLNDPLVRINLAKFLSGIGNLTNCVVQALFVEGSVRNTTAELVDEWIEVIGMIKPLHVQICTLTRPGARPDLKAADEDALYAIAHKLKKRTGLEAHVFVSPKS